MLALALLQASALLRRHWRLSPRLALLVVVLVLVLLLAGGSWLVGASAVEQLQSLRDTLPQALAAVKRWLAGHAPGRRPPPAWAAAAPQRRSPRTGSASPGWPPTPSMQRSARPAAWC